MLALDRLFMISAFAGGGLFLVQLILMFVGGHADVDTDVHLQGHAAHDAGNASFKVLSLQGITAFVMMFGLVGWAMRADSQAGPSLSLTTALGAGAVSTWGIAKLFAFFARLQSSGTLNMHDAYGATGQVYLTVGPGRPGKVSVTIGTRLLTIDAVTEGAETLATGTSIRVVGVISDTTVCVERD